MNIFRRRSEWDYSWLKDLPTEVSLCRIYEYARYALLRAAPNSWFVFPRYPPPSARTHLWGPIFCLLHGLPEKIPFPQITYREARELFTFDPKTFAAMIEEFPSWVVGQKLAVPYKELSRQQAEEFLAQFKRHLKRGAGAPIRQQRTDLKYLGAAKLLDCMHAPDAIAYTTDVLGWPLLRNESEWTRAKKRVRKTLEPYFAEAADQYQALEQCP